MPAATANQFTGRLVVVMSEILSSFARIVTNERTCRGGGEPFRWAMWIETSTTEATSKGHEAGQVRCLAGRTHYRLFVGSCVGHGLVIVDHRRIVDHCTSSMTPKAVAMALGAGAARPGRPCRPVPVR